MKYFLIAIILMPFLAIAQDCKLQREVDPYTKEVKLTTGFITISPATLSIEANSKEIDFLFSLKNTGDTKCFDDASTATILFDGSRSKMNIKNSGTMNCDGYFHITFRNSDATPGMLQRLATNKITSISLTDNSKNITLITIGDDKKQQLMDAISCVAKDGKTLIKQP